MRVFQILDNDVLIIKDNEQYSDTAEHFKADSGIADLPIKVIYDDTQKQCLVDDNYEDYPNANYDGYIDNVTAYIEAKASREYVPPTLNEVNVLPPIEAGASCFNENSATDSKELRRLTLSPQA